MEQGERGMEAVHPVAATREAAATSARLANAVCAVLQDAIADALRTELEGGRLLGVPGNSPISVAGLVEGGGEANAAGGRRRRGRARPSALRVMGETDGDQAGGVWGEGGRGGEGRGVGGGGDNGEVERDPALQSDALGAARHWPEDVRSVDNGQGRRAGPGEQVSLAAAAAPQAGGQPGTLGQALERSRISGRNADGEGRGVLISVSAELVSVVVVRPAQPAPTPTPPLPAEAAASASMAGEREATSSLQQGGAAAGDGRLARGARAQGRVDVAGRAGPTDENPAEAGSWLASPREAGQRAERGTVVAAGT
jgi:hypothetical protein